AQYFGGSDKTYVAEITLGVVSDTYDADGVVSDTGVPPPADWALVYQAVERFRGRSLQTPPPISAKKVQGVAAYQLDRRQIPVELKAVEIEVKRLEVEMA